MECILTNLDEKDFPIEEIKKLYGWRWGIERSFRELKYTIGLTNFHAKNGVYPAGNIRPTNDLQLL